MNPQTMKYSRSVVRGPWSVVQARRTSSVERRTSLVLRALAAALALQVLLLRQATAQDAPRLTQASQISVITILPGTPLYSSFGHTAIRVRDDSAGIDVGYNYGTFDFDEEGFYVKFLRGKLDYVLARDHFDDVLYSYQVERRPVLEQPLRLSLVQRQTLFDLLEVNHLPENRAYRYEFLFDNCSTRPRDIIERAWGHPIAGRESSDVASFRGLIDRYLADKPWTRFGIDLLLGSSTDIVAPARDRMFLPDEFMAAVDEAESPDGLPLSEPVDTLYWAEGYERWTGALPWPGIVGWVMLIAVVALSIYAAPRTAAQRLLRRFDGILFLTFGTLGVVIVLLWFATEHTVTKDNWNIIWALPTHVLLGAGMLIDKTPRWITAYLWITLGSIAITVVGWTWIPQELNPWLIPFLGIALVRSAMGIRTSRS